MTRLIAWLSAIVVLLCWYVGQPLVRKIRNAWPIIVVLAILASTLWYVVLDNLAAGYIEKMLGA